MLVKNFCAYADEHKAADEFGRAVETLADMHANVFPDHAHQRRDEADNQQRAYRIAPTVYTKTGKGETDGHRVDAGGYGEGNDNAQAGGVHGQRFFFSPGARAEKLSDFRQHHLAAYEQEQTEGYPMVVGFYLPTEDFCRQPTDKGHQSLEKSEKESHRQHLTPHALLDDAAADAHAEAVHSQRKGKKKTLNYAHGNQMSKMTLKVPVSTPPPLRP